MIPLKVNCDLRGYIINSTKIDYFCSSTYKDCRCTVHKGAERIVEVEGIR